MPENNPIGTIVTALLGVMRACGYVQKTGYNNFHRYSYAKESDVLDRFRPAMIENGLILIPSLEGEPAIDEHGNTNLMVSYTLAHTSGAVWPYPIRIPGCGNDKSAKTNQIGDKGVYKALTGANKYMMFKLFQIATGDDPEVDNQLEAQSSATIATIKPAATPAPAKKAAPAWDEKNPMQAIKSARVWADIDGGIVADEMKRRFPGASPQTLEPSQARELFEWVIGSRAQ